ncbi:hypothetical protein N2152v2_006890 [Parachlorella kessleri]
MAVTKDLQGLSYSAQYDELFSHLPLNTRARIPKPSLEAQSKEPNAKLIPGSDVWATQKLNNWTSRYVKGTTNRKPVQFTTGGSNKGLHLLCLAAPFTFSWPNFWLFLVLYCAVGCLGIDVSFHRQLTHRSFTCPKWLEYFLAYLGTLGLEHDPIEWVKHHRYHHQNTDTPLDPHKVQLPSPQVLDDRTGDNWIVKDLCSDAFYRFIHKTYNLHVVGQYMFLYWLGGFGAVVWGGALRQVLMWHVTWLVNSACHAWGARPYNTGDLSTNNSWLAIATFGESWHNNHHAFPFSARHGLEWWQVDIAWGVIRVLQFLGLAWDIRLPSEAQKRKLATAAASGQVAAPEEEAEVVQADSSSSAAKQE